LFEAIIINMANYFTNIINEDGLFVGIIYDAATTQEVKRTEKLTNKNDVVLLVHEYLASLSKAKNNIKSSSLRFNNPTTPQPNKCKVC